MRTHLILVGAMALAACSAQGDAADSNAASHAEAAPAAPAPAEASENAATATAAEAPQSAGDSGAHRGRMGVPEWQRRASSSFSSIDRASLTQPERYGLRRVDTPACRQFAAEGAEAMSEACSFVDRNGVAHSMLPNGEVFIKTLDIAPGDNRAISALGIGTARSMQDVLERVRIHLPGAFVDCRTEGETHEMPSGQIVEVSSCGAQLGDAWVTLLFGRQNEQLLRAEYHAFQAN